jgi:hypothetical protein
MVRFLMVEPIRLNLNLRFDICVVYLWLIIFSVVGPVDNETLLMTNFMNLKIKSIHFFKCDHMGRTCVLAFMENFIMEHSLECHCLG